MNGNPERNAKAAAEIDPAVAKMAEPFRADGPSKLINAYGGMWPVSRPVRGGLAPWQERRAKEILHAKIKSGVALKEAA